MMGIQSGPRFSATGPLPQDADAQMRRYQQQLDDYFQSSSAPLSETCCSVQPKKPMYQSPFAPWLKAKSPIQRAVGNVLDWFCWFWQSIVQDFKTLLAASA